MPLEQLQNQFGEALLDPELPLPDGVVKRNGGGVKKRFDVYRNNVVAGLVDVLRSSFPVTLKIVGDEFFTAMAAHYVRENPPESPILMDYGTRFPAFLENFAPVAHLAYLADGAMLEQLRREAYHAADAIPLPATSLAEVPPDALPRLVFTFIPSTRLMASRHPVLSIWEWNNTETDAAPQEIADAPEIILITRPEQTVALHRLPPGADVFLSALLEGATLGDAAVAADKTTGSFDLTLNISLLLQSHAIAGMTDAGEKI